MSLSSFSQLGFTSSRVIEETEMVENIQMPIEDLVRGTGGSLTQGARCTGENFVTTTYLIVRLNPLVRLANASWWANDSAFYQFDE